MTTQTNNLNQHPPPVPPPPLEVQTVEKSATTKSTASVFPSQRRQTPVPTLRFSPYAWAKLLGFRDAGPTEIAGFGVALGDDPLLVEDFITVRQSCTAITVAMDDQAVADFFDDQVDLGRRPEQFMRIWLHTHPGSSPNPSGTDEETFERVFGKCDWAIMAILARGGQTYARLRFGVGPGAQMLIPVDVDFSVPFPAADHEAWRAEFERHVQVEPEIVLTHLTSGDGAERAKSRKDKSRDGNSHDRRSQRWHEEDSWDLHDMRDAEALAELEAELAARGYFDETEVPFDAR